MIAEHALDDHLVFLTESGLSYVYDNKTGLILPLDGAGGATCLPDMGEASYGGPFTRYAAARPSFSRPPWTPERVKRGIVLSPSLQLTLVVTERCTLRCRYCVYAGSYDFLRTHSSADMSVETALRAVDFLVKLSRMRDRGNPGRTPALGFYGGEPLLRMDLIKEVVEYTERIGFKCSYNVTTNGTIDNPELLSYLVRKKFSVAVSFDGPPEEQDRNRIFPNGRGSFDRVYGFLTRLREAAYKVHGPDHPSYMILTCADRATDLANVCRFFDGDEKMFGRVGARVTMIYPYRTSYYDGWKKEDLEKSERTAAELWPGYRDALVSGTATKKLGFRDWVFGLTMRGLLHSLSLEPNPLRGACIPGSRLAVDYRGQLHVCERVNQNYPVGDIETGLDFEVICHILRAFERHLEERCRGCGVTRLCSACFSMAFTEGLPAMDIPVEFCEDTYRATRRNLSALFSILERNPNLPSLLDPSPIELEQDRIFNG